MLIYATPQERDTVEAMLRKIDILPLQVRIDAVIAEVTLNDRLQIRHAVLLQGRRRQRRAEFQPRRRRPPTVLRAASRASC